MAQAIGGSLVFAIGFAVTSLPIAVIVLIPLSKGGRARRRAFAAGWVLGTAGALAVVIACSDALGAGSNEAPATWVLVVKILLGTVLVALAGVEWHKRPGPGEVVPLPTWLRSIERITPRGSAGLGLAIAAANPKNLLMIVGGGLAIAEAPVSVAGEVVAGGVFVALAVLPVVTIFALSPYLGPRAQRGLETFTGWIEAHNTAVMAVLLLIIGVALVGNGLAGI